MKNPTEKELRELRSFLRCTVLPAFRLSTVVGSAFSVVLLLCDLIPESCYTLAATVLLGVIPMQIIHARIDTLTTLLGGHITPRRTQ